MISLSTACVRRSGQDHLSSSSSSITPSSISITGRQECLSASSIASMRVKIVSWLHPHLHGNHLPSLLHLLLGVEKPGLPELYPLVCVAHTCVLYEGTEHHEEADEEVNIDGLHVGNLRQSSVDRVDEGGHGEHSGHAQAHPGGGGTTVQPEGDPGHHNNQAGGDIHLE